MDPSEAINIVIPALITLAVVGRGFRVDDEIVARWEAAANITLTDRTRPVVRRYLVWSRRCRTSGGLAGFLAPVVTSAITGTPDDPGGWSLTLAIAGYLLGALVAEVVINRHRRASGTAVLVPRRLDDYLPRTVLLLQRGLAILAAAAVGVYAIVEPHARLPKIPSVAQVALAGLAGVAVAVLIEAWERRIVARRQTITDVDDLAVDDAMRSSSLHVLAGVAVALLVYIGGGLVMLTIVSAIPESVFEVIGLPLVLLLFASSVYAWARIATPHRLSSRRRELLRPRGVSA